MSLLSSRSCEYGLLVYRGDYYENIGDYIQSLAARQFLPQVDHFIAIDEVHSFVSRAGSPVKLIMNGWFTCNPDAWPPSSSIEPLFISFHIADVVWPGYPNGGPNIDKPATDILLSPQSLEYLARFQPIGCRDLTTARRLSERGVQAYFSGCLTLTLQRGGRKASPEILIVDVVCDLDRLLRSVPTGLMDRISVLSHYIENAGSLSDQESIERAEALVDRYRHASFVVTSRLHCALPCIAVGTPVLFVLPKVDHSRLPGLVELMNCVSPEQVDSGEFAVPWNDPMPNPGRAEGLSRRLQEECWRFVSA